MKYVFDHDLHIHSKISLCSSDPEQTNERILQYAIDNGLKTVCLTNHFWDDVVDGVSEWYMSQNYEHLAIAKPLPQVENVKFLFGCETELNKELTLGISKEKMDLFDFIVIPTTHFHMTSYTLSQEENANAKSKAKAWVKRVDAVLGMDLPFHKVGLAHLTCGLIAQTREEYLEVIRMLPEEKMKMIFEKAAQRGVGIELNYGDMNFSNDEEAVVLRPYRIAKQCGCKFYCGSDAHHPGNFVQVKAVFERAIDLLELTEDDKFVIKNI